eukprot:gene19700-21649_t
MEKTQKKFRKRSLAKQSFAESLESLNDIDLPGCSNQKEPTVSIIDVQRDCETGLIQRKPVRKHYPRKKKEKPSKGKEGDIDNFVHDYEDEPPSIDVGLEEQESDEDIDIASQAAFIEQLQEIEKQFPSRVETEWAQRKRVLAENWASMRNWLFCAFLLNNCTPEENVSCSKCQLKFAAIRCTECRKLLCSTCDEEVHADAPFHDREIWKNGFFEQIGNRMALKENKLYEIDRPLPVNIPAYCPGCDKFSSTICKCVDSKITIITTKGRFEFNDVFILCQHCDFKTIGSDQMAMIKGKEDPLYKDQLIADDSEVQIHMKTLYEKMGSQDYNEDKMCGSSYWQAARKIEKFASSLAKQYAKTKKKLAETVKEKNALLNTTEVPPDATTIEAWEKDFRTKAMASFEHRSTTSMVSQLAEYYKLHQELLSAPAVQTYIENIDKACSIISGQEEIHSILSAKQGTISRKRKRLADLEKNYWLIHQKKGRKFDVEFKKIRTSKQWTSTAHCLEKVCLKTAGFQSKEEVYRDLESGDTCSKLQGIKCLKQEGIATCKRRLSEAANQFRKVLENEPEKVNFYMADDIDGEEEQESNESEVEDDENDENDENDQFDDNLLVYFDN